MFGIRFAVNKLQVNSILFDRVRFNAVIVSYFSGMGFLTCPLHMHEFDISCSLFLLLFLTM
jgi:hypothetical protein